MKPRRPEVAMAKEGKTARQGRLGTQGQLGTRLLRVEEGGARHALASGMPEPLRRNPCLYKRPSPLGGL